jgi:glycosyltransferase involved in cell wall biosynthesis
MISIVVPCYNEEESIRQTCTELIQVMERQGDSFELIFVDDGSKDNTLALLYELQHLNERIRIIALSRNFGHQLAVTAGIDFAQGDAVVLIDADLQDPPELIPEMIQKWKEGYQVIYGQRIEREGESLFKKATARWFYRLLNKLSEVPIPLDTGDFRLMDRKVVEELKKMREHHRFIRGMVSWVGYKQIPMLYKRQPRYAGKSKYPLQKMLRFTMDGMISFSTAPLKMATYLGFFTALLSIFGIFFVIYIRLATKNWVQGWTTILLAIMFFSGVQLITIGIIGEYIGRVHSQTKNRPLYVIKDIMGFTAVALENAPEINKGSFYNQV